MEQLDLKRKFSTAWEKYDSKELDEVMALSQRYIDFMSLCKTERECVDEFVIRAEKNGYKNLTEIISHGNSIKAGDKIYVNHMGKALAMFLIGTEPIESGLRILGAHIDSPRLDLKQNPLFEEAELAYLKTHYYGGIKKYQWLTLPLAIHGVFVKKDGTVTKVVFGEEENEPVVGISDLLVHLAGSQMEKTLGKAIEGEQLNVMVGSIPVEDKDLKERVKLNILNILNKKYGITEADFVSAEIEIVPAGRAKHFGLDNSMVLAYGHDDRICSYTSFEAMLNIEQCDKTCVTLLVDKEEVGSIGATGMHSRFFENALAEIINLKESNYTDLKVRRTLANSKMLSSDVSAAFDPSFADAFEKNNSAYFGRGIVFNKYTGSRGKSGCNDANAEYLAQLRNILDRNNVAWQTAELGKVDQGGGGTIAYILAQYGMDVIDSGVALHSMHAPYELASKADIYETCRAYEVFLKEI
ncbi:Aspartyl aminopeptidase [Hathewaya proteolytica DSM 3090]|uniref:M18 family aminopeptidase n=1 Tax=Hathewaya proteolytica DSM 3090 TaxID=1121331 RepID=A0A1M6LEF8_9CLOT|nr:aminopeptidase [Hathewaya proteolytica]SHJ69584.1 Aspartyl aminopeptidase [Hathewaya proteolytica DSM 3090]